MDWMDIIDLIIGVFFYYIYFEILWRHCGFIYFAFAETMDT